MAVGKVGGKTPVSSSQADTAADTSAFDAKSAEMLTSLKSKSGASTSTSREFEKQLAKLSPADKALTGKELDSCLNKCATKATVNIMQRDFFEKSLKKSQDDLLAAMKDW